MNISSREWMAAAQRRIDDAHYLLIDDRVSPAAVQTYYAVFYTSKSLLEARGLSFKRHSSVTGNFGRVEAYRRAFDAGFPSRMQYRRERCDYELWVPDRSETVMWLKRAETFVSRGEDFLETG